MHMKVGEYPLYFAVCANMVCDRAQVHTDTFELPRCDIFSALRPVLGIVRSKRVHVLFPNQAHQSYILKSLDDDILAKHAEPCTLCHLTCGTASDAPRGDKCGSALDDSWSPIHI